MVSSILAQAMAPGRVWWLSGAVGWLGFLEVEVVVFDVGDEVGECCLGDGVGVAVGVFAVADQAMSGEGGHFDAVVATAFAAAA